MKKVLIIGSGIAGSLAASYLEKACKVTLMTKGRRDDSNSMLAQGGIAAALAADDDPYDHLQDTLTAGCDHNDPQRVEELVTLGPEVIQSLIDTGMKFDQKADGSWAYGLEGAHRKPRVLHCGGDQTGKHLTSFIQSQLAQTTWLENCTVSDLLIHENSCQGVVYLQNGIQKVFHADLVILATGGIGQLFPLTTNNWSISGDGIALAARAGATLKDMEFVQFHPTLLVVDGHCQGLISEAVRGEGARLVMEDGTLLMAGRHPQQDLAPRDVVSRVIKESLAAGHTIYLDISPIPDFTTRFPHITQILRKNTIPFETTHRIPVEPGAHFFMGGIETNEWGETSIHNLYAIGETACTGVHGANRLASNSLLEGLVFAKKASEHVLAKRIPFTKPAIIVNYQNSRPLNLPTKQALQERAWDAIGIVRDSEQLQAFLDWLAQFHYQPLNYPTLTEEKLEIANLCLVAEKIAQAALERKESLGAHAILKKEPIQ